MPIINTEKLKLPTKANYSERVGRKVTDLQPLGQGSGITEVIINRPGPNHRAFTFGGQFFEPRR